MCSLRRAILALTTLCLASLMANVVLLNFTIILMVEQDDTADHGPFNVTKTGRFRRQISNTNDSGEERMTAELIQETTNTTTTPLLVTTTTTTTTQLPTTAAVTTQLPTITRTTTQLPTTAVTTQVPTTELPISGSLLSPLSRTFHWTTKQQSQLFSVVAVGALLSTLPFAWLCHRRLAYTAFLIAAVSSILSTGGAPIAIHLAGHYGILGCRMVQGVGMGVVGPLLAYVASHWSPIGERPLALAVLCTSVQWATACSMLLCVAVTLTNGWEWAFYAHALFAAVLLLVWCALFRSVPRKHPWISGPELNKILVGKWLLNRRNLQYLPYGEMLSSVPVWTVLLTGFAYFMGLVCIVLYMPMYMRQVHYYYDTVEIGLSAALPLLFQVFFKVVAEYSFRNVKCPSETVKTKVYNSLALFGMAAFLALAPLFGPENTHISVALLTCAAGIAGLISGGFLKSAVLVAQHFGPIVLAALQLPFCLALFLSPIITTEVLTRFGDWKLVFWIHAGFPFVGALIFLVTGSGIPADWTGKTVKNGLVQERNDEGDNWSIEAGILEMKVIQEPSFKAEV